MLRLKLKPRPDPILTNSELRIIEKLLRSHIDWVDNEATKKHGVSESMLRTQMDAESALPKIKLALEQ